MSDDEYEEYDNDIIDDIEDGTSVTGIVDLAQTNDIPVELAPYQELEDQETQPELNEEITFADDRSEDDNEAIEPEDPEFDYIDQVVTENTLRKTIIVVDPNQRRTSHIMTAFEYTEAIVIRASQIERRQNILTNVDGLDDAEKMAEKELYDGKCPLILRRKVGEKVENSQLFEYYEYWDVNTMTKPVMRD